MDFNVYSEQAWSDHAKDPRKVAEGFKNALSLLTTSSQITAFVNLVAHVYGEHLASFDEGISFLEEIKKLTLNDADSLVAVNRSMAILKYCLDSRISLSEFSTSDQIRIMATSASALVAHKKIELATLVFEAALDMCAGLSDVDPANRAMAVVSNNLACAIEELSERTEAEKQLMILAALSARKYWQLAGTWLDIERAEYRLSQSYLRAGDYINSIKHANLCLTLCEQNSAGPLEFFFAYEAIASVEKAMAQPLRSLPQMQSYFAQLPEADKTWCESSLEKFK
jgi:hypothetical protein